MDFFTDFMLMSSSYNRKSYVQAPSYSTCLSIIFLTISITECISSPLSTQKAATELELKHVQEDHDRLMERHSALLSDMAAKERQSREKQEQLVKLANSAEKARQDAIASLQEQTEALRQNYRVRT